MESKKGNSLSEDNKSKNLNSLDHITYQTLEMDADSCAIGLCFDYIDHINSPQYSIPEEFKFIYEGKWRCYDLYIFAIYTSLRLFGEEYQSLLNRHPPSGLRQSMILSTVFAMFEDRLSQNALQELAAHLVEIATEAEQAFQNIALNKTDISALLLAHSDESKAHVFQLLKRWSEIRPSLENYAYVNLAPIHPDYL